MASDEETPSIRRIAIIGAGPIGLAAAKYLLAEDCFTTLDIYEQQSTVGGAWLRTEPLSQEYFSIPQTNPLQPLQEPMWMGTGADPNPVFMTAMYDGLETNIPKELMQFSDFPFPDGLRLFPPRQEVVGYIERYASDVRDLIRFQTQVVKAELVDDGSHRWRLTVKGVRTGRVESFDYDALVVCSGHYAVPSIPSFPGLQKWSEAYPGAISHTKWYRSPGKYAGKKVLVIGNAASGTDISDQISRVSQLPLLLSQRGPSLFSDPNGSDKQLRIRPVPEIAEFINPSAESRALRFADGHIERDIDAILFATGFMFHFPFLPCAQLDLLDEGTRVKNTYQHVFHISVHSLAFLGLPIKVLPFPTSEAQAAVLARVWSGRLKLPSKLEMQQWEEKTLELNGAGKSFHNLNFPKDFDYQRLMFDWASQATGVVGKLPTRFGDRAAWARERFPAIKRAFAAHGPARVSIRTLEDLGFDYEAWLEEQDSRRSAG